MRLGSSEVICDRLFPWWSVRCCGGLTLVVARRGVDHLGQRRRGEGGGTSLAWRRRVERRPLMRLAAGGTDDVLHQRRRHLLAMDGAGRAGVRLVHNRAATTVDPAPGAGAT